ncbi:UPF0223 family protein [Ligilactobacillus apodemi]|uniref:Uncharacterized protein n=1 Tax=Ligilactobacillus apodemi DSM 16634 = JCM 16172 TaxID=1423724 RepID=A0A0R1TRU1_9LACO|nr:UPF0223 family protein [Ligilactobacillus apodemi]KRL84125.1 hypothetical protein FC32_GL001405 [Ligilactobacillus apodemi DSM 16634 = JCM 16172]MBD5069350.1 UPF0223 family protein [Lactobacillus sp.]MCR1900981.1 UPF0223 family protein [Ligilactobacillus apodemi]
MKISENFEYPLLPEWSTQEIIDASEFYEAVEKVYTTGIERAEFMKKYIRFLEIEPAIMTQKQLDRAFSEASGLSIYRAVQFVKNSDKEHIKFTEKS